MHSLKDAQLIQTIALPAAAGTAHTGSIDLLQGPFQETHFEVELTLPDLPSLADGKNVSARLEDSVDGITFAPIAALTALVVTGAGGNGAAAASRKVRLPSDTQRYLRATLTADAAGGNNTAQKWALALVF